MRVANTTAPRTIEFVERPLPAVQRGTALVRVEHVTLCGTDFHIWEGEYLNPFPIVQGHEIVGTVASIQSDHPAFQIGSRVAVSPVRTCGKCHACSVGRSNVCRDVSVLGCYEDGAFAEFIAVPISALHSVPETVPSALAPLSEPASIALQAVQRGRPQAGELALVIGCGPIGLIATLALREAGVDVVAADTVLSRTDTAREFGAASTVVIDVSAPFPTGSEIASAIGDSERPVTLIIEATGSPAAFIGAVEIAAPTARVVAVGISDREVTIPMCAIPLKELDILGSRNSLNLIDEGLRLIERNPEHFAALVTHRFAFEEIEQALSVMRTDPAAVRKVLISFEGVNVSHGHSG